MAFDIGVAIALIISFGVGVAWARLFPPEPYIDRKHLKTPDYGGEVIDRDLEANISLAQSQQAEAVLKEQQRQRYEETLDLNTSASYRKRYWGN